MIRLLEDLETKRKYTVDLDTGEVKEVDSMSNVLLVRARQKHLIPFIVFDQTDLLALSKRKISRVEWKVFLTICSIIDWENTLHMPLVSIAEICGLDTNYFGKVVKRLVEHGLLEKIQHKSRYTGLRINPGVCWKGNARARAAAIKKDLSKELEHAGIV